MNSSAARAFALSIRRADSLLAVAREKRQPLQRRRVLLEAAVAAAVAGWDSYVKNAIRAYQRATFPNVGTGAQALHSLLERMTDEKLGKFNTPNSQNVRVLLISVSNYDPWPDWTYPRKRMNSLQLRDRLDEILKVRHSFAHGHAMPAYSWNTDKNGVARLTAKEVSGAIAVIRAIVIATDMGLERTLCNVHGITLAW